MFFSSLLLSLKNLSHTLSILNLSKPQIQNGPRKDKILSQIRRELRKKKCMMMMMVNTVTCHSSLYVETAIAEYIILHIYIHGSSYRVYSV